MALSDRQSSDLTGDYQKQFHVRMAQNAAAWLGVVQESGEDVAALDGELDNLMKSVQMTMAQRDTQKMAFDLMSAAWRHAELRGHWLAWQPWIERGVHASEEANLIEYQARLLDQQGESERLLGRPEAALACFEQALALAQTLDDRRLITRVLAHASQPHMTLGRLDVAEACCRQALSVGELLAAPNELGLVHNNWGMVCNEAHDFEQALVHFAQAETYFRQAHNRRGLANAANNRGNTYRMLERYVEADTQFRQALIVYRELGDELYQASVLNNLSIVLFKKGQLEEALELNATSTTQVLRLRNTLLLAQLYNNRGLFLAYLGLHYEAQQFFEEAAMLYQQNANLVYAVDAFNNCAEVLLDAKDTVKAACILSSVEVLMTQITTVPTWLTNDHARLATRLIVEIKKAQSSRAKAAPYRA